jgi:DnaJ-class molecular chaperone
MALGEKDDKDLYAVLGVSRDVKEADLRKAYRRLARKYHPDVNPGNKAAEEKFKEVSAAYDVLNDPAKRQLYDEFGVAGIREGFDPEKARAYQAWSHGRAATGTDQAAGFDFDLGDIFGDLFAGGRGWRGRGGPQRGQDLVAAVEIDLAQAITGAEVQLALPSDGPMRVVTTVRIPPGADDGSRLRVAGRGAPGKSGGPPGDLVIETHVRPHPYFTRRGLDLVMKLPVTLAEAFEGSTVEVPTPTGLVRLKVPPRSQQGTELRLRGKGVAKGKKQGDLYVVLDVRLPDEDTPEVRAGLDQASRGYSRPVRDGLRL